MTVVVEGDKVAVVLVNPGSGNDGTAKITANILCNDFRITFIRLGINIESVFVLFVAGGFDFFEGRAKLGFHLIQESSAKSVTEIGVVKMFHITPEAIITVSTFRDETVNVWIPFQISSEGVKNHDETRSVVFGFIHFKEQRRKNAGDGMEETVEQSPVFKEELTEILIDGEDTMPVSDIDQFK